MTSGPTTAAPLRRDGVTVAGYAMITTWGWWVFCIGPVLPLLGREMGVSNTVVGLHATGVAVGSVTASALTVPLVRQVRRDGTMVVGCVLLSLGVLLVVLGPSLGRFGLVLTLGAMVFAGTGGTLMVASSTAALDGHHGRASSAAVTEANGLSSGAGLLAPLAVGGGVALGLTWRPGLLLLLPLAAGSCLLVARAVRRGRAGAVDITALRASPGVPRSETHDRPPLPKRVWVILAVVMTGVGMELSLNTWSAELLRERTVLSDAAASASIAAFALGMTIGRFAVAPVANRYPSNALLQGAGGLLAVGWLLLWSATLQSTGWVPLALVGLALCGAGVGGFFPLGSAWLVRSTLGQADRGMAKLSLGIGFATGLMPFALGAASDVVGVHAAFLIVPAMILVACSGLWLLAYRSVTD